MPCTASIVAAIEAVVVMVMMMMVIVAAIARNHDYRTIGIIVSRIECMMMMMMVVMVIIVLSHLNIVFRRRPRPRFVDCLEKGRCVRYRRQ
jgi:hypothetical protein